MEIRPALQPIPERLKLLMLLRKLYLLTTMAESDGVGEKRLQFTMSMSMSLGFREVFFRSVSMAENITCFWRFWMTTIRVLDIAN